jgi:hypothetical protein
VKVERKEKQQKRPEKCGFFEGAAVNNPQEYRFR